MSLDWAGCLVAYVASTKKCSQTTGHQEVCDRGHRCAWGRSHDRVRGFFRHRLWSLGCCGKPRGQHAGRLGASAAPPADAVVESGVALRQSRLWDNVAFTRAPGSWQPWKTTQDRQVRALRWQPKAFRQALSPAWEGARVWPACETHTPHHRAAGSRCDSCRGVGIGL